MLPPVAPQKPHTITLHGESWEDPYFWLRYRETDPDVMAYLQAENEYTEQALADTTDLQAQLFAEMKARIKETDLSALYQVGAYWYYTRTEQGQQYSIYCRKHGSLEAAEEVLLDANALAHDHNYCRVGVFRLSPDHRYLAYAVDYAGDERYTLHIKDLNTGALLPEVISNTYYGTQWANDSNTLFYNTLDAACRPYRVYRHTVGSDPASDVLVYEEPDEHFFLFAGKTHSKAYLLLQLHSTDTTEVHYLPADQPQGAFTVVQPRQKEIEYSVEHHGDYFLIISNEGARNFQLLKAPIAAPAKANWQVVIPHRDDVLVEGIEPFTAGWAVYERAKGLKQIRLMHPATGASRYVAFPEPAYDLDVGASYYPAQDLGFGFNPDYDSPTLRFVYSSLVTPRSVIDYEMAKGEWTVTKQDEIPSGYDASLYQSERLLATANDGVPNGVQVPISLVYKKPLTGPRPLLLYSYGSYGASTDPNFSTNRLSLLERGFVFAMAHIRGGSELGRAWYEDGKLLNKRNTFTDFIACAEHLIKQGYTTANQLTIQGGSAGGLLMGAVVNLRPDLFRAVIAKVPFVDVISTMSDPTIPLTVIEYDQWGNPADKVYYDYMKSYSPYDNVEAKAYPNLMITTGLNDPRVAYWEPAKWIAKLRATKTDTNLLILKTNMDAGHGGASGRYDWLKEIAFDYAFLLKTIVA